MNITNQRTGQRIEVQTAITFLAQIKGLMFAQPHPLLMVFKTQKRISLHTLFVFFALDVFYLDKLGKIIEKTKLLPFSYYSPKCSAVSILEVPTALHFKAEIGDCVVTTKISFVKE